VTDDITDGIEPETNINYRYLLIIHKDKLLGIL